MKQHNDGPCHERDTAVDILLRYDSLRLLLLPPVVLHDRLVEVMSRSLMFCGMIALVAMPLQGTDDANAWVQRDSQWLPRLRAPGVRPHHNGRVVQPRGDVKCGVHVYRRRPGRSA